MKSNVKEMINGACKERKITKRALALKMGYAGGQYFQSVFDRQTLKLDSFYKIMDELGYDIVIKDRINGKEMWKVEYK